MQKISIRDSSVFLIFILSALSITTAIEYNADGWKAATDFLLEAIDTRYDPCENFFKFACGKWQEKYAAHFADQTDRTVRTTTQRLITEVSKIPANDKGLPRYKRSLRTLYDQCMDSLNQGTNIVRGFYKELETAIGPLPLVEKTKGTYVTTNENLYTLLGKIHSRINVPILMDAQVIPYKQGCEVKPLLYIMPGKVSRFIPSQFANTITNISETLNLRIESSEIEKIADKLRVLPIPRSTHWAVTPNYTVVSLPELANMVGEKNVQAFFKGLLPSKVFTEWTEQNPSIGIEDMEYFRRLFGALSNLTRDDIMALAYWRAFQSYSELHKLNPWGTSTAEEKRALICINKIKKYASGAAVRVLFESFSSNAMQWKNDLEMLAETILASAKYLMQTADWLDISHKRAMVEKIESMKILVGIPDWILDDEAIELHTPNYDPRFTMFENDMKMFKKKFMWKMRSLKKMETEVTGYRDENARAVFNPEPIFEFSAMYWVKVLHLYLGAAVPPMYNYTYPLPLKYGLIGWIIAHELFHGFHYGRSEWDPFDDVKMLMSPEVRQRFEKRVNCIRKQYSNFCYPEEGFCLSGSHTINDNIADIDGLKVTYMAFQFMSQLAGESFGPSRPEILRNYTLDQVFFLSAARVWCARDGFSAMDKYDVHSPPRARVELSMVNFPAFAQAFRCHAGQRFAPVHSCNLWGDFLEPKVAKKK